MPSPDVPTVAQIGYGTIVAIEDDGSPPAYVELLEVKDVTPPNQQVDDVEVTHYQSPNRTREYIAGLIEGGEASVTMNRREGSLTEQRIQELQLSGTRKNVKITWPLGTTWEFIGHVKGYETTAPVDGVMEATVTLKVDSNLTITVSSPPP